jgi:hypothetical protein
MMKGHNSEMANGWYLKNLTWHLSLASFKISSQSNI